jgi:hypothetical protein
MKGRLMRILAAVHRRRSAADGVPVFGFVCGLLVGVLIAALAIPDGSQTMLTGEGDQGRPVASADADPGTESSGWDTDEPAGLDAGGEDAGASLEMDAAAEGSGHTDAPAASAPVDAGPPGAPQAAAPETGSNGAPGGAAPQAPADEPGPAAAASSGAANPGDTVRGVTGERIRIGVAVPDLGAIRHLGPEFNNGEPDDQWRAMQARWEREGTATIHGRELELVFRKFDILSTDSQRATCVGFVQDDQVFMVVGITYYHVGSECVAREFRTPLLTSDGMPDEVYDRAAPNLFTIGLSSSRLLRNLAQIAHERGALRDKTIGIYHLNDSVERTLVNGHLRPALERLGYEVAEVFTTNNELGGPEDAMAVQRFRAGGVDLAILLTSKQGFLQQAEAQRYTPDYLESDYEFGTSDTNTARYPPAQFDGTFAVTGRRAGEVAAGMAMDAEQNACIANYEQHAGRRMEKETAEWSYVLMSCDLAKILKHALNEAGPNLTNDSFIAGMRTIRNMQLMRYLPASFTSTKHHGTEVYRPLVWEAGCRCWKAAGDTRGLPAQ